MDTINRLIELLLAQQPEYRGWAEKFPQTEAYRRFALRGLMNVYYPDKTPSEDYYRLQDRLLQSELAAKGTVDAALLPPTAQDDRLVIWQGDITRLSCDAIVNAANAQLLGCFVPGHNCIDNAIHSAAGLQLREACARIMAEKGHEAGTGEAEITPGYNLPARYVLHTVGPIIEDKVGEEDKRELASCYRSCLALASEHDLGSVAFCCISTGLFRFPNRLAAEIAVKTVQDFLDAHPTGSVRRVIFNVFKDEDREIYHTLLD